MATALKGTELVRVVGVQSNGVPSGEDFYTTTAAIAESGEFTGQVGFSVSGYATSTLTATSNTTLTLVPGMTATVVAGGVYDVDIYVTGAANASGGIKFALGGTATATSLSLDTWVYNTTTVAQQSVQNSSLSGNLAAYTGVYTTAFVTGTIVVNAGGTITLTAAQNASNASATTVLANSNIVLTRIA